MLNRDVHSYTAHRQALGGLGSVASRCVPLIEEEGVLHVKSWLKGRGGMKLDVMCRFHENWFPLATLRSPRRKRVTVVPCTVNVGANKAVVIASCAL